MSFVGDTKFVGDGGANLQILWEKWPWRPIPNSPGKYTMRRIGDGFPPEALCETAGLGKLKLQKLKGPSDKELVLIELDGGGGLITVVKGDGTYLHTLLTKSTMVTEKANT